MCQKNKKERLVDSELSSIARTAFYANTFYLFLFAINNEGLRSFIIGGWIYSIVFLTISFIKKVVNNRKK